MLEKDSRAGMLDYVFLSKHDKDSVEEVSSLSSEITRTSNDCTRSNNIDSTSSEFHFHLAPFWMTRMLQLGKTCTAILLVLFLRQMMISVFLIVMMRIKTLPSSYNSGPEMENFEDVGQNVQDESAVPSHVSFVNGSSDSDFKIVAKKKVLTPLYVKSNGEPHLKILGYRLIQNVLSSRINLREKEKDVYVENGETFNYIDSLPEERKRPLPLDLRLSHPQFCAFSHRFLCNKSGMQSDGKLTLSFFQDLKCQHGIPAEVGSSSVNQSSCRSSGLNEISEEMHEPSASTRVMERSAEQRLGHANLNNGSSDDRFNAGAFVDMEHTGWNRFLLPWSTCAYFLYRPYHSLHTSNT
ncbi:hypothetical protein HAX54_050704 [Datura stramonium]|uniref:Uncharacterized protein n=1 Tax=Datura stramonium TaxID=4076 RepID=A0ABS8WNZ9_DATST|nr:hypothetical protein [Datura stramonium]